MQSTVNGNSVQHIIELDKKARQRVAEAKSEAERIIAEAEEKKEQLLKNYRDDSKKHLNIVEKTYRDEADKKIEAIEAEKQAKLDVFDKRLDEHREELMNSIFEAVTGTKRRR